MCMNENRGLLEEKVRLDKTRTNKFVAARPHFQTFACKQTEAKVQHAGAKMNK